MEKGDWYKLFLILVFFAFWLWAAINPSYRDGWLNENYLVFVFIPIIILTGFYFKLSNFSYTLITIFMILHTIGSHYTYSEVPFGYVLQEWFNSSRNMYDRLVHFSFGLLLAYPVREVFMRLAKVKGFWAYYFPIDLVLAFSATYELIEWIAVISVNYSTAGVNFLGAQGDIWDAQKDMLVAGIGAIIAMSVTLLVNWIYNKGFWRELKSSFKIPKGDKPLGEVILFEMIKEKSRRISGRIKNNRIVNKLKRNKEKNKNYKTNLKTIKEV